MRGRSFITGLIVVLGCPAMAAIAVAATDLAPATRPAAGALASKAAGLPSTATPIHLDPARTDFDPTASIKSEDAPFSAAPGDPMAVDALFDEPVSALVDLTALDAADWRPEHALAPATVAPPPARRSADKGIDPEPDAAIVPPPATSTDPIDKQQSATPTPAQAEAPLAPLNQAIKAALDKLAAAPIKGPQAAERRKEREAVAFFYAAHGFAPAWSEDGKAIAAVEPVLARLARADEDALSIGATPKALKTDGRLEDIAESEIALTDAVVAYARQATGSRIEPRTISPLIGAKPELADPAEVVDAIVLSGAQAGDKLQALNPIEPRYLALREKLAAARGPAKPAAAATIPPGPTLKIGMHDARVPALRARLGLEAVPTVSSDDLVDDSSLEYDAELSDAVAAFQRQHGMPATGVLTKRTVAALSGGERAAHADATIIANMEMWRWMPRDLGRDRIEVNVPAFTVTVFHDNEPVARHRVVVGKTETPTPLFSNTMKYLIVNPLWNVPKSIIEKEMLPKGGGDLSYLDGRGYRVTYHHGQVAVQQLSGPKNALGRIKFMFPNDYSVYLHDTPSKSLFSATKRAFSHGCVRVDQPFDFAESVLNDGIPEGGRILWNQKRLEKLLGDKERYVYLPTPLPIHIEYFTAVVDAETGRLTTYDDVYGYARAVAAALGEAPAPAAVVASRKPRRVAERAPKRVVADPYPYPYLDPDDPR